MSVMQRFLLMGVLALWAGAALAGDPSFTLTDDGSAFLYRARPGDQPASVAAMFGIRQSELPAFLAANGITDATRVAVGHVYRIPNPLAARAASAEAEAAGLGRELAEVRGRGESLASELRAARDTAAAAERRARRLVRLEWLWPIAKWIGVLLVLALGAAITLAVTALRKAGQAERYAGTLASDVEEKRRTALAERQESAKRILDLEAQVHDLELRCASEASTPRRRGPAAAR